MASIGLGIATPIPAPATLAIPLIQRRRRLFSCAGGPRPPENCSF
jgi:hypothetical protein